MLSDARFFRTNNNGETEAVDVADNFRQFAQDELTANHSHVKGDDIRRVLPRFHEDTQTALGFTYEVGTTGLTLSEEATKVITGMESTTMDISLPNGNPPILTLEKAGGNDFTHSFTGDYDANTRDLMLTYLHQALTMAQASEVLVVTAEAERELAA